MAKLTTILTLLAIASIASAKPTVQPWALLKYDPDSETWKPTGDIYPDRETCEQWRRTQISGVYACAKAKKIPAPPTEVVVP